MAEKRAKGKKFNYKGSHLAQQLKKRLPIAFFDVRGSIKIESAKSRAIYSAIVDSLTPLAANVYLPDERTIEFKGPWIWWHNWQLLLPVSFGQVKIENTPLVVLKYQISMLRLRVICAVSTVILFFIILLGSSPSPKPIYALKIVSLSWVWLYGMNWLIFTLRFRSFLNRAISSVG